MRFLWQNYLFFIKPGIYELLGCKMVFNNNAFMCRYCGNDGKCKKGQDNPNIQDGSSNSRLIEDEETLDFIRPFAFEGSSLNRMNSAPPDPMHDLPEGVIENVFEF